jgi:hypothetical protein
MRSPFPFNTSRYIGLLVSLDGTYGEISALHHSFLNRHQDMLLIKDTTLSYIDWKRHSTYLYFEVQKTKGDFSPNECDDLVESLKEMAFSLISSGNTPIPSSEVLFKVLRYLMSEVKEGDPPHVLTDLFERKSDRLSFLVFISQVI